MATTTRLKTYDDLARMPEDGNRYELIGGEIVMTPAPTWLHQVVIRRLLRDVGGFVDLHDLGQIAAAPLDVHFSANDVVQPDIIFVRKERYGILIENGTIGAPDLAVEVLSPSTQSRDLGAKMRLYERGGVREYWVVDVLRAEFRAYTLTADGYRRIPVDGTIFRSLVLPGLEIDVVRLFRPMT
jgi:Uma2 family endonuclease